MMDSKVKFKELLQVTTEELKELTTVPNPDFRLEQAEYNDSKNEWDIIFHFYWKTQIRTYPE